MNETNEKNQQQNFSVWMFLGSIHTCDLLSMN